MFRTSPARLILLGSILTLCLAHSAQAQNARTTPELTAQNFKKIKALLVSPKDESGWRQVPWRPNLGEAIVEARKKDKPILLWMMNGHPCGMT